MKGKVAIVPLRRDDKIDIGKPLPWSIYNESNVLLLRAGTILSCEAQAQELVQLGLFRDKIIPHANDGIDTGAQISAAPKQNPFHAIDVFVDCIQVIFADIRQGGNDIQQRILKLSADIQAIVVSDPNAVIGATHLYHDHPYGKLQPIYTALLSELLATRLGYDVNARQVIIAATLTANIATEHIQDKLNKQKGMLTEKARMLMNKHPKQGVKMLKKAGVTDKNWLAFVLSHHERPNGSGYPEGLTHNDIPREAKLISIADIYLAMTTNRGYRSAKKATDALREIFAGGKEDDQMLYLSFIKELTIFPPGTFVRLENGEIGVVTKRSEEFAMAPKVKALISQRGGIYSKPYSRDCKTSLYAIKEMCILNKQPPINMSALWEYD